MLLLVWTCFFIACWHIGTSSEDVETGWQTCELKGKSGTLQPAVDLDMVIDESGTTLRDVRNTNKLVITFDNECELASTSEDFLLIIHSLMTLYPCLYTDDGYHAEHPLYHLESINSWLAFLSISSNNDEEEKCINQAVIDYDEYCIGELSYAMIGIEDQGTINNNIECVNEVTSQWHLDFTDDGVFDNIYNHVDLESQDYGVDMYILDRGVLSTHTEFEDLDVFFRLSGFEDSDIGGSHGTHVAGIAVGRTRGVAKGVRRLFNYPVIDLGVDEQFLMDAFEWVLFILNFFGRRGVINMSFGYNDALLPPDRHYIYDAYLRDIIQAGGVPVTSAGNGADPHCDDRWPQGTTYVITVGNFQQTTIGGVTTTSVRPSSNYGSCVDIYGPGTFVSSALHTGDNDYGLLTGTSMASPHISGIIAQILSINSYLSFWQIRELLNTDDVSFILDSCPADSDAQCRGIRIDCDLMKLLVTPIEYNCPIVSHVDIDRSCQNSLFFGLFCRQCSPGYFQRFYLGPCYSCQDVFGADCQHCADYLGCQQCASPSKRAQDPLCGGLWYCQPSLGTEYDDDDICTHECLGSPCECWELNNCATCHRTAGCEQCENGYFYIDRNHQCEQCQEAFGNECLHCSSTQGCQQCASGYTRVWDNSCGSRGYYKCV